MKDLKKYIKNFIKDESGQGTTEYILILVVVVGVAIAFKDPIMKIIRDKVGNVGGQIQSFTP